MASKEAGAFVVALLEGLQPNKRSTTISPMVRTMFLYIESSRKYLLGRSYD
jgi:hypothetical protein